MSDSLANEITETTGKVDTISSLFEERDRQPLQEDANPGKPTKQEASPLSSQPGEGGVETEAAKVDDQAIDSPDLKTLQAELEKTRKTIAENQKYGRQNAQRLKSALKLTKEMVENGALSEAEAQSLMESLSNNDDSEAEVEHSPYAAHPFGKVLKIANTQLENLRKYSDDELLDDKVKAFDYFLSLASQEEVKDALEELTDLIDDPIKLTKKMLAIGKRYYDESYKDIASSGSVQNYIKQKHQEIEKLNRSIDKLTKKLAQYEDYDQPRHRISEVGESNDMPLGKRDLSDDLFYERDKDDLRRQKRLA